MAVASRAENGVNWTYPGGVGVRVMDEQTYHMVAVKRRWVPEWLWGFLVTPIPWPLWQPFRWLLTKPVSRQ